MPRAANSCDVAPRWPSSTSIPTHLRSRRGCRRAQPWAWSPSRVRDTLDHAVADVVDRFGRLDVAIANAGILSRSATLRNTPAASVESLLAVNVTGVVNTVQAAMDQIIAHRGQIVLISSVFAFLNGMGTIPYAMSKAPLNSSAAGFGWNSPRTASRPPPPTSP